MFLSIFMKGRKAEVDIEIIEDCPDDHEFMLFQSDGNGLTMTTYMTRGELDDLCDRVLSTLNKHDRMRIERDLK